MAWAQNGRTCRPMWCCPIREVCPWMAFATGPAAGCRRFIKAHRFGRKARRCSTSTTPRDIPAAARANQLELLDRLNQAHSAPASGEYRIAGAHPQLRDGGANADLRHRGARPLARVRDTRKLYGLGSPAQSHGQLRANAASWRGGWSNRACGSCRFISAASLGIRTIRMRRNSRTFA